jgi:uncharacterized protein YjbI with pentapeptide repeats
VLQKDSHQLTAQLPGPVPSTDLDSILCAQQFFLQTMVLSRQLVGNTVLVLLIIGSLDNGVDAFVSVSKDSSSLTARRALWRHWIPTVENNEQVWELQFFNGFDKTPESSIRIDNKPEDDEAQLQQQQKIASRQKKETGSSHHNSHVMMVSSLMLMASLFITSLPSHAVSGGGLDFANLDITGKAFSNGNYKGKDFTQVIAKGTTFANSNLQGCRFYKAYLVRGEMLKL